MPRNPSPETQLRSVKRELKEAAARYRAIQMEMDERRRIGAMLSNICYHGKNCDRVPEDFRRSMKTAQEAWDGIQKRA